MLRRTVDIQDSIQAASILQTHIKEIVQTGTGSPPAVAAYVSFTSAYGTPPAMFTSIIGPYATTAGTLTAASRQRLDLARIRSGSFQWTGTPLARARWIAIGIGTTPAR